jgi:hypothetical protein
MDFLIKPYGSSDYIDISDVYSEWETSDKPTIYIINDINYSYSQIKKIINESKIIIYKNKIIKPSVISEVNELKLDIITPKRSGVIVYTIHNNNIYFGMGVDTKTGELTDFGGGVKYKYDINAVNGGLREFSEESLLVFGALNINDIKYSTVVYDNNVMLIFIFMNLNINYVTSLFRRRVKYFNNPEIIDINWLTVDEFLDSLNNKGRNMYSRVKRLIQKSNDLLNCLYF